MFTSEIVFIYILHMLVGTNMHINTHNIKSNNITKYGN